MIFKFTIYALRSPSGKYYVGYSNNFDRRMRQHKWRSKSADTYLARAIRHYGWDNFEKLRVDTASNLEFACALEQAWAIQLNSYAPHGYNTIDAGHPCPSLNPEVAKKISNAKMGHVVSASTRKKISDAQIGMTRKPPSRESIFKSAETRRGAKRSLESRQLMSKIRTGKKVTDATRAKMRAAQQIRRQQEQQG